MLKTKGMLATLRCPRFSLNHLKLQHHQMHHLWKTQFGNQVYDGAGSLGGRNQPKCTSARPAQALGLPSSVVAGPSERYKPRGHATTTQGMNGISANSVECSLAAALEPRLIIKEEIKEEEDDIEVVQVVKSAKMGSPVTFLQRRPPPPLLQCALSKSFTTSTPSSSPIHFQTTAPSRIQMTSSSPDLYQTTAPSRIQVTKMMHIQTSNPSVIQCSTAYSSTSASTRIRSLSPPSMITTSIKSCSSPMSSPVSMNSPPSLTSSPSMMSPSTSSKISSTPTVYLPQRPDPAVCPTILLPHTSASAILLPQHPDPSAATAVFLPQHPDPSAAPSSRLALLASRFEGSQDEDSQTMKPMPTLIRIQNQPQELRTSPRSDEVRPHQQEVGPSRSLQQEQEAYVRIVEQPKENSLRFRYECEGRSAGSLQGVSSTSANKTYPSIEIVNQAGPVVVVASCVTVEGPPYRTHPHNLVGRDCQKGVCTINVNNDSMYCTFQNVGIQCVRRKDVEQSLVNREAIRVDPFKTGFEHRKNPNKIDLNAVRICFQVFAQGTDPKKFTKIINPVVSNPIYDAKAKKDLLIIEMSDDNSSVDGGRKIIILCEKVAKEDIQVVFFEESEVGDRIWEAQGDFRQSDVHKQYGICFRTPPYRNRHITNQVKVAVELRKANDRNESSDPVPFFYTPSANPPPVVPFRPSRPSSYQPVDTQVDISYSISEDDLPTVLIPSIMDTAREDDVTRAVYGSPDPPARKVSVQKTVSDLFGSKRSNGSSTSGDKRARWS